MNIRVTPQGLRAARSTAPFAGHRARFNPRAFILDEVVAGLLWMALDLPQDVSRIELEGFARQLIARIRFGAGEDAVGSELAVLQSDQLGRPANRDAIRDLAARVMHAVKGF